MFEERYPIAKLHPAPYNPRLIEETSFERLKESLSVLGLLKPVIATQSGTLLAGHQRTKAMQALGIDYAPAFILPDISIKDEIRFNQLHNASDVEFGEKPLHIPAMEHEGFIDIAPQDITGSLICRNAPRRKEILNLLTKYGSWGSMIATQNGEILVSKLYAQASKILGLPCKAYIIPDTLKSTVIGFFGQTYGKFSYNHLPKTTWAQSLAQMMRLRSDAQGSHSRLYEHFVLPRLKKNMRILDFGAGQKDYVKLLKSKGYDITGIEFYLRKGNAIHVSQVHRDIDALCTDLAACGLFDVVICDSVLNSVDSLQAEHDVLTCLNALCKPGGLIFFSGRSKDEAEYQATETSIQVDWRRRVEFFDDDGFSAMYSAGVWRYQKFHTAQQVFDFSSQFFGSIPYLKASTGEGKPIEADGKLNESSWSAIVKKAKELPQESCEAALAREFNLPLPEGKRYNRQDDIIKAWRIAREKA